MIVFVPMAFKLVACVILALFPFLKAVWAIPPVILLSWVVSGAGVKFSDFKMRFLKALYGVFFVLLSAPWLARSKKSGAAIVGLALVVGLNLADVVTYVLSTAPVWVKVANLALSALMIGLSIWKAREEI